MRLDCLHQKLPADRLKTQPISLDAIQSFRYRFRAVWMSEKEDLQAGLFNAITRSGSNNVRGGCIFLRTERIIVGSSLMQTAALMMISVKINIGGKVGGPVYRDKLFYFVNGEYKSVQTRLQ